MTALVVLATGSPASTVASASPGASPLVAVVVSPGVSSAPATTSTAPVEPSVKQGANFCKIQSNSLETSYNVIERSSPKSISAAQIQLGLIPLLHLLRKIGEEAIATRRSLPGAEFADWVA